MSLHVPADARIDSGSLLHTLPEFAGAELASLVTPRVEADAELLLGHVRLAGGATTGLHRHDRPETVFVLAGSIWAQRGVGRAEVSAPGAVYFPPKVPHAIEAAGGSAVILVCYSRGNRSAAPVSTPVEEDEDPSAWPNPNRITGEQPLYRWALSEEYENELPVEPTKGRRVRMRYLFDPHRGADEMVVGTGATDPHTRYTRHHHEPAELYYVLSGSGTIFVGDEAFAVAPGSTVYVPAQAIHGIDTHAEPLDTWWVYGLEHCGPGWAWVADEPVHPRPD